ncbi:SapC family protein [Desulfonatronovibrio magnus]|uniref:SapC family protein n=1 Tax=Desulfonatronovibrio magnus TaxID=698827 RepID=UPI0005EADA3C|nr:SapC family protein [Desulfonatronovibrio magnus]
MFYSKLVPVSPQTLGQSNWLRPTIFPLAVHHQFMPVCLSELPRAAAHLPIIFLGQDEDIAPRLMMSLVPGENHYFTPGGKCLEDYLPMVLRPYPFAKVRDSESGTDLLCIEEEYVVSPDTEDSIPIFTDEGQLTPHVTKIMQLIKLIEKERLVLNRATKLLNKLGILADWPVKIKIGQDKQHEYTGLKRVGRTYLHKLSAEHLPALHECAGLELAFAQIISSNHFRRLNKWANIRRKKEMEENKMAGEIFGDADADFLLNWEQDE